MSTYAPGFRNGLSAYASGTTATCLSTSTGAVAVLWVRLVYPGLCRLISAIPRRVGKKLAAVMAVFLAVSTVLSAAALYRMDQRREGVPAGSAFSQYLDEHFPDSRLQARYPNMGILD